MWCTKSRRTKYCKIDPYQNADGIGHLTTEIWWSMIEMGISVVAACLPTIGPFFGNLLPERVIQSIRSIFSLQSFSSRGHTTSTHHNPNHPQFSNDQTSLSQHGTINEVDASGSVQSGDLEAQKASTMPSSSATITTRVSK